MRSAKSAVAVVALSAFYLATPAYANETITYTYDTLGRLVQSNHSGTVNNGVAQTYTHDAADNRTNVTVTGSPYSNSTRVIVVPLAGLTVLVIGN